MACTLPHRFTQMEGRRRGPYIKPRNVYQKWRIGISFLGHSWRDGGGGAYKTWENVSKVENWHDSFFGARGMEVGVHHKTW